MLRIVVLATGGSQVYPVPREAQIVGSAEDCAVRLVARGVSRRHARLIPESGGLRIEDLGSRNGLWFDGKRCLEAVLRPGDHVQLGTAWLSLERVSSSDAEPALRLPDESASGDPSAQSGETDQVAEETPLQTAFAGTLLLAKALDRGASLARLLRQARSLLGAETLLVFGGNAGVSGTARAEPELALRECAGKVPSDALFYQLLAAAARTRPVKLETVEAEVDGRTILVTRGGVESAEILPYLGVVFVSRASEIERWQRDVVSYLAEKLLGSEEAPPPTDETTSVEVAQDEILLPPAGMVLGDSAAMQGLLRHIRATLRSERPVLLVGEPGTGKELFARMIHNSGPHAKGPYVAINCAAIPSEMLEAEMFGVRARVATGVDARPGHFTRAEGGTIFLDEIGDMSERLQAKILRVLQEREIFPLGAAGPTKVNVRVIAASNRDLQQLVKEGLFRQDLYDRLGGAQFQFHIPPLRERKEDVPALVLAFAMRFAAEYQCRIKGVSQRALRLLANHDWPGNVRELEMAVDRAVLLCSGGGVLSTEHFGAIRWAREHGAQGEVPFDHYRSSAAPAASSAPSSLQDQVDDLERRSILAALNESWGNKTKAAKALGVTRYGLTLKMKRLGIRYSA